MDANPPLNQPVPLAVDFTGYLPMTSSALQGTASGSYTLLDTNASATTPLGTTYGCRHYTATGSVSGAGLPVFVAGIPMSIDIWYHESLGLVKFGIPALGVAGNLSDTWDLGGGNGTNVVRKMGILSASNATFELNTYDRTGTFDADKNQHAKMLSSCRFADDTQAKTAAPAYPAVTVEFGTVMGVFSSALAESPVSLFHPEENGQGFKYAIAFVSEAAKNEPGANGSPTTSR